MRNRFAMSILALALAAAGVVYASTARGGVASWDASPTAQANATDDRPLARAIARRVFARVASELKLSDAQQTEIKQIVSDELANARPLFEKLRENRQQLLRESSGDGQFDEARVRAIAAEQGQTLSELIVARERARAKIFNVLTPEQRARAEELLERFAARRGALPFAGQISEIE